MLKVSFYSTAEFICFGLKKLTIIFHSYSNRIKSLTNSITYTQCICIYGHFVYVTYMLTTC